MRKTALNVSGLIFLVVGLEISDEGPGELWRDVDPGGAEFCRRCGLFFSRALDVLLRKKILK